MFLAGVVCDGGFPIGEARAFGLRHLWEWFWLSGGFLGCMLCCPMVMWCIFGGCVGSPESRRCPP